MSLLALDRMSRGLKEAGSHTVTVGSSLSFTRQEGVDDQGESRWAGEVLVYRLDAINRRLIEERYPPQPPALARQPSSSAAIVLTPGELAAIASQDNRRERVVASDVVEFSAAWSAGQTQPLTLTLELERPLPHGPAVRFEISRQVSIRNP